MKRESRILSFAVAFAAFVGTGGCRIGAVYYEDQRAAAVAALNTFHERLAAGDYEAIYSDSTNEFRSLPKDEMVAAMKQTTDRWGKPVQANIKASSCFPFEVRLVVETQFERGLVGGILIWRISGDSALLQHARVFPGPVDLPPGVTNECRSPG